MRHITRKRLLSFFLAMALILTFSPISAAATYGINMEKSSLYAVPTSTCNLLLSKDQCQPYYPNGRQCWDMKRRDFVTGKESVP